MTSGSTLTPVRRQYLKVKSAYPDALLLFRMGDFYETFDADAELAARELEIALTSRTMGKGLKVPMAGVPAHALESYLARLIKKGHKVAICEQLTDPATSKGLVERDVVRVVTPGTVLESSLLDQDANNYLAALVQDGKQVGLAYVDITTGRVFRHPTVPRPGPGGTGTGRPGGNPHSRRRGLAPLDSPGRTVEVCRRCQPKGKSRFSLDPTQSRLL